MDIMDSFLFGSFIGLADFSWMGDAAHSSVWRLLANAPEALDVFLLSSLLKGKVPRLGRFLSGTADLESFFVESDLKTLLREFLLWTIPGILMAPTDFLSFDTLLNSTSLGGTFGEFLPWRDFFPPLSVKDLYLSVSKLVRFGFGGITGLSLFTTELGSSPESFFNSVSKKQKINPRDVNKNGIRILGSL